MPIGHVAGSTVRREPGATRCGDDCICIQYIDAAAYAELHCRSNFSFLTGASHPEELVERAAALGYSALAITDECSLAGVVRAHVEAKTQQLHLVIGSEMRLVLPGSGAPHARLVLLAQTRRGYGNLSHWITVARRRAEKGSYLAHPGDVEGKVPNAPMLAGLPECLALLVPSAAQPFEDVFAHAMWLKTWFQDRAAIAVELLHRAGDDDLVDTARSGSRSSPACRIVAAGDVLMHVRSRKPLQDTLTATRLGQAGGRVRLRARAQRRAAPALARAPGRALPAASGWRTRWSSPAAAASRSASCATSTRRRSCRAGETPASLAAQARRGRRRRSASREGLPEAVPAQIENELALIAELEYEPYFLTVADIVALGARAEHPLPGPRQRRQLARLLLPRRHRGRPAPRDAAVRALHQRRAQRAARHRHRLRAPAPRGGDPVHLRASTAGTAPR